MHGLAASGGLAALGEPYQDVAGVVDFIEFFEEDEISGTVPKEVLCPGGQHGEADGDGDGVAFLL